ncbi:hypothetical protein LZ32DRAFT_655480 [Colletotrichum eremochloae]|nr:hypothetical protein LZ32DRAFT_655480 [Colletotrichum eremochloae]
MKAAVISSLFFALSCYCTNSDGTPAADDIQQQACLQYAANERPDGMKPTVVDGINTCVGQTVEAGTVFHLDNCEYAKVCNDKGATGQDPVCTGRFN